MARKMTGRQIVVTQIARAAATEADQIARSRRIGLGRLGGDQPTRCLTKLHLLRQVDVVRMAGGVRESARRHRRCASRRTRRLPTRRRCHPRSPGTRRRSRRVCRSRRLPARRHSSPATSTRRCAATVLAAARACRRAWRAGSCRADRRPPSSRTAAIHAVRSPPPRRARIGSYGMRANGGTCASGGGRGAAQADSSARATHRPQRILRASVFAVIASGAKQSPSRHVLDADCAHAPGLSPGVASLLAMTGHSPSPPLGKQRHQTIGARLAPARVR